MIISFSVPHFLSVKEVGIHIASYRTTSIKWLEDLLVQHYSFLIRSKYGHFIDDVNRLPYVAKALTNQIAAADLPPTSSLSCVSSLCVWHRVQSSSFVVSFLIGKCD